MRERGREGVEEDTETGTTEENIPGDATVTREGRLGAIGSAGSESV